jgi:hypothetical protein
MIKKVQSIIVIILIINLFAFCGSKNETPVFVNAEIQSLVENFKIIDFNKQFGSGISLDFSKSIIVEILYLGKPEKYIVTPLFYNNGKQYGSMYSLKNYNSSFRSLIVNTSLYNINNGYGKIDYIGVGIDKAVSFVIEKYKISTMTSLGGSNSQIKHNSVESNLAPSCTGTCYKTAKDACDNDPDCKLLCDLLPTCNGTIAASCFLHCFFE